jgi:Helicase HerA, central domain
VGKQHLLEEEEETSEQAGPNWTLIIVGYFAVLAVVIVLLRPLHLSMGGIFFSMVIAGVALALAILLVKGAIRKVAAMNMTAKDTYHLAIGYIPEQGLEEEEESDAPEHSPASFIAGRDPLHLGEHFRPSFHSFLSMNTLIVGIRRSGKSNLLAVLVEELARFLLPFILFDTMGEYTGLVDKRFLPRARLAGNAERMGEIPEAAKGLLANVTVENAYSCGQIVMKQGLQLVVNLKGYNDEDAALIMSEMSDGVNDWQEDRRNRDRIPFMFFIDEAQKWFPESLQEKPSDITPTTFALLQEAFVGQVVERGGKNGLGLVVATQRYSRLKKSLLQSLWKFYFRQSEEIDLARYKRQGIDPDEAKHLAQGECIVYGPDLEHFTFLARRAAAPLEGHTPGASALAKYTRDLEVDDIANGRGLPDLPRKASGKFSEGVKTPHFDLRKPAEISDVDFSGDDLGEPLDTSESFSDEHSEAFRPGKEDSTLTNCKRKCLSCFTAMRKAHPMETLRRA